MSYLQLKYLLAAVKNLQLLFLLRFFELPYTLAMTYAPPPPPNPLYPHGT
jgi:hypothetical protein